MAFWFYNWINLFSFSIFPSITKSIKEQTEIKYTNHCYQITCLFHWDNEFNYQHNALVPTPQICLHKIHECTILLIRWVYKIRSLLLELESTNKNLTWRPLSEYIINDNFYSDRCNIHNVVSLWRVKTCSVIDFPYRKLSGRHTC